MKKSIIIASIVLAGTGASAEVLSPAQALQRINSAAPAGVRKAAARAAVDAVPRLTVKNYDADPELYMFAPAGGGILLVSAESEAPALLGYTDSETYDGVIPPALEYLMNCYAEEIHAKRMGNVIYGDAVEEEDFEPIPIVCPTTWNQGGPYYDMCPDRTDGFNPHYATGCVATAMAQVLYTHKYPARCSGGEYSYIWRETGQELTINFDDVELDWDNMLHSYGDNATQEQKDAVATLMKALGYASNMNYTPGGSGTHGFVMAAALVKYFDYDITTTFYQRRWFPMSTWKKMIYDELATGHAVYMDAQTGVLEVSAHAFMIDGYQGDGFFHVNWGWGGMSDGYFLLTTMEPGAQGIGGASVPSGYCASQGIILGMEHGRKGAIEDVVPCFYTTGELTPETKSATLGESVKFNGAPYYHITAVSNALRVSPAIKFTHENGTEYWAHEAAEFTIPSSISGGLYSMRLPTVTVPADLPEGNYTVSPAVYSNRLERYIDVYTSIGMGGEIAATVAGQTITFAEPEVSTLELKVIDMTQKVSVEKNYNISLELTNSGTQEYDGYVNAWLVKQGESKMRAHFNRLHTNVAPGSTVNVTGKFKISDLTVASGEYEVVFLDQNDRIISGRYPVRIYGRSDAAELTGVSVKCLSDGKNDLAFEVTATATEGNFRGNIYIELRKSGNPQTLFKSKKSLIIKYGETETTTITGTFPDGKVGSAYSAYVCYTRAGEQVDVEGTKRVMFTLKEVSALNEIETTANDITEYYDLSGRRVDNPTKGIYIRRTGSATEKIAL